MNRSRLYTCCYLIVLLYMFTFSLGESRLDLFTVYAYLFGFASSGVLLLYIFNKRYLTLDYTVLLVFLLIQLLTLIFGLLNGKLLESIVNSGHQVMFFIIFIGIIKYYDDNIINRTKMFSTFIVLASTVSLFFALYGYFFGDFSFGPLKYEVVLRHAYRLKGWYQSANHLGPVLAVGGLTILHRVLFTNFGEVKRKNQYLYLVLFALHIVGIILTGSKGTYLAFLCGILVLFFSQIKLNTLLVKNLLLWLLLIFLSIQITILSLGFLGFDAVLFINELIRLESLDSNLEGGDRVAYYFTALDMLQKASIFELLFGYGIGHFLDINGYSPHSGYIELITGRGIIIFSLFILLLSLLIYKSKKMLRINSLGSLYLSILVLIIFKNFTNTDFPSNNFPGIILIYITAIFAFKK